MKGFIKDYRKELDSDIWLMPPLYHRVWQYLKYKVNHKKNKIPMSDGTFLSIDPGQHLTSIRNIAKGVGYYEQMKWKEPNPKTISKILEWLEKQSMISIQRGEGNRQYTLITLSNWELHQVNQTDGNSEGAPRGEGQEHPVDINKNDLECFKNDLEDSTTTDDAIVFYQNNFGSVTPYVSQDLLVWLEDLGDQLVIEAMKRAVERNKRSWGYVKSILQSWQSKNIRTVEQAKAEEIEFKNQRSNQRPSYSKKPKQQEVIPDWFKSRNNNASDSQQIENEEKEAQELDALLKNYRKAGGNE